MVVVVVVLVYDDRIERRDVGVGMRRMGGGQGRGVVGELWMLVLGGLETWHWKEKGGAGRKKWN